MKPLLLAGALVLTLCSTARAQDTLGYTITAPRWAVQFSVLGANALIGGVTGGLIQELRGGSFRDGFARGALGGTIIYAGKRIAAERFAGAGLIGREVGAVGASVVRNASDGIGTFDRLILPVGFARVYWNRARQDVAVKLDVVSFGYTVYAVIEDHLDFAPGATLSAGAPVFRTDNEVITYGGAAKHAAGISRAGVILQSYVEPWGEDFLDRAMAHERVHVLQDDQLFITLNDHLDDWLLGKLGPAAPAARYIDLNGSTEVLRILSGWISRHADRPWEIEAIVLTP